MALVLPDLTSSSSEKTMNRFEQAGRVGYMNISSIFPSHCLLYLLSSAYGLKVAGTLGDALRYLDSGKEIYIKWMLQAGTRCNNKIKRCRLFRPSINRQVIAAW
jgi:hypothetical protein